MLDKVYEQSVNLVIKAAEYYYYEGLGQSEISERLEVSVPTVSRLLKKAREMKMVEFYIPSRYLRTIELEKRLMDKFHLRQIIVSPDNSLEQEANEDEIKKNVAMEGARYLQRIITADDTVGVAWGGTMYYLINYLNPSQRVDAAFATLHGSLSDIADTMDAQTLVSRMGRAFNGKGYYIFSKALMKSEETVKKAWNTPGGLKIRECFRNITLSISGVGAFWPEMTSPLSRKPYLSEQEVEMLRKENVCADIMLRFINRKGEECDTVLKDRTISIDLEEYRTIPNKVIVASGYQKAAAVSALIQGRLVDTLIIDLGLAEKLIEDEGEGLDGR